MERSAFVVALSLSPALLALSPGRAADLPSRAPHVQRHAPVARRAAAPEPVAAPFVAPGLPPREVGSARGGVASPTALLVPGTTPLPSSVDVSPVFLPQRVCGPGYSPGADQTCLRHGELRVRCDDHGLDCAPLPPDPMPYGPGPYMRLAY